MAFQLSFRHLKGNRAISQFFILSSGVLLTACAMDATPVVQQPKTQPKSFVGLVSSGSSQASKIGQDILLKGGTAGDAATAMGFYLMAVEPTRVSLLGGGICQVLDEGETQTISFNAAVPETRLAIPMMARGLFSLHSRTGELPWKDDLAPAIQAVQNGFPVSNNFASDLVDSGYGIEVGYDFGTFLSGNENLKSGGNFKNPSLANILTQLADKGAGAIYDAPYGPSFIRILSDKNVTLTIDMMKQNKPKWDESDISTTRGLINESSIFVMDKSGQTISCQFAMGDSFGAGYYVNEWGSFVAESSIKTPTMVAIDCANGLTPNLENCKMDQKLMAEQKTMVIYK